MYPKPMPKQDKVGGIIPTAEGARLWVWKRQGKAPSVASSRRLPSLARPQHAGNPRLNSNIIRSIVAKRSCFLGKI